METIQVVLDQELLQAADRAARRTRQNRSALIRDALRRHLHSLETGELEERDKEGYARLRDRSVGERVVGSGGKVAGGIARGDVRLYQFAPPAKKRPVVVLTRDSVIGYLNSVTVAPITSTVRGVPSEVLLREDDGMKAACAVNPHHVVTVSRDRLGRRVSRLSRVRMGQICGALRFSLGCTSE